MTSRDFCYWLQGFFELHDSNVPEISERQIKAIKAHLSLVFLHEIDPSGGPPEHQAKLNAAHAGFDPNAGVSPNLVTKEQLDAALKQSSKDTFHALHQAESSKVMRC